MTLWNYWFNVWIYTLHSYVKMQFSDREWMWVIREAREEKFDGILYQNMALTFELRTS